jgi:predicted Holliday junction resolvase-like endonuclease
MSNLEPQDKLIQRWIAEDAELPEHLRPEEINRRWNDLTPDERTQIVMLQQIERRKNHARREAVSQRPRAIGPVDRALQKMSKY